MPGWWMVQQSWAAAVKLVMSAAMNSFGTNWLVGMLWTAAHRSLRTGGTAWIRGWTARGQAQVQEAAATPTASYSVATWIHSLWLSHKQHATRTHSLLALRKSDATFHRGMALWTLICCPSSAVLEVTQHSI